MPSNKSLRECRSRGVSKQRRPLTGLIESNNMTSQPMRNILRANVLASGALALAALFLQSSVFADAPKSAKPKPYPLPTCVVSGEKLGGDMGDPYVFTHEGREIKLCCKSCLKDFNKEPAKFIKKLDQALKNPQKGEKSGSAGHEHGAHNH